jgi:hypothetical protein
MAYTNINDPSTYFQTVLWTGNGTAGNAVTFDGNSDMQPDFVWSKRRDVGYSHVLKDTSRGGTSDNDLSLVSNSTAAESTYAQYRMDFDSDGFTLDGAGDSGFQGSGTSMVSWAWKANGGTTTAFSESGSNPGGTRQTNTDAGFSIISYTGTGSNGTIAHGLPSTPEFIIFKRRDATQFWCVWHQAIGDDNKLALHLADGLDADGAFMASTLPTSTNITVGGASVNTNADNGTYICYAFSPIQGYSKFGKYVGNGSTNGPFVYTGFKPALIITKNADATDSWNLLDNKRSPYNVADKYLQADNANAEGTYTFYDILSNGFKIRNTGNANISGNDIIYMAFAENPFVTSTGVPTTAR